MALDDGEFDPPSVVLTFVGCALFLVASLHHLILEPSSVDDLAGPAAAFLLDGGLSLGVVVAGVALARSRYGRRQRRTVALFGIGTAAAFALALGLTMVVRVAEGRVVTEPVFVLLTAAAAGVLTGALAGTYRARGREHARSAARSRDTLAFVNGMLRHDVRNDANIIAGYAGQFADTEAGAVVRNRAEAVVERTDQARAVAETVAGEADPEPRALRPFVVDAVESAGTAYPTATVAADVPEDLTARTNEAIRPVLDNLIENAVEHHDAEATVEVRAERDGPTVELRVVDDGPGIPPAERDGLFDHDEVGTAKGLHVVDTIVDGLGGRVHAEPRADGDRGTAVVVRLPAGDPGAGPGVGRRSDANAFEPAV